MNFQSMRVDDKIAIVTGSGSGIGQALAIGLANYGADVVVTELPGKEELAEKTASEVRALSKCALVAPLDVTSLKSIQELVDKTVKEFGRVDILVNNAGINIPKPALEVTEKDWDLVLDINLKGTFFCSQAVARDMIKRKYGKIINIVSQNGVVGYYKRAAYCSSKAGQVNLTRVLAIEWAPYGINVNAMGPTFVKTPLTEVTFADKEIAEDIMRRIPIGRLATLEDMVGAVVFLASPASDMVTGHTLLVDGGWTAI